MKRKAAMSAELKAEYEKQLRRIKRFVRQASKRGFDFPDTAIPRRPKTITEASIRKVASITPDTLYKKATYKKDTGEVISGVEGRKHERQQAAIKAAETRKAKSGSNKLKTNLSASKPKASRKKSKKSGKQNLKPREKFYQKNKEKKNGDKKPPVKQDAVVLDNVLKTLEEMIRTWSPLPNWTPSFIEVKRRDKNTAKMILDNAINQLDRVKVARNCEKHAEEIISLLEEILYASGSKEGNFKDGRTQVNADIISFQSMLLDRATTPKENWDLNEFMESLANEDLDEDTEQYYSAEE